MSPPRHNRDQGLARYEDGAWGVDAYIGGRRVRKKVGGKQAARDELARLKHEEAQRNSLTLTGPNFDTVRHALATIEEHVAAMRYQLATSRAREQAARSALARLIQAAQSDPDDLAEEVATAEQTLEQLYTDAD